MSVKETLRALGFHDSTIRAIELRFGEKGRAHAHVAIDYYDWEGNADRRRVDSRAPWRSRALSIRFGFVAHFEYSAPFVLHPGNEIDRAVIGDGLTTFEEAARRLRSEFPRAVDPLFGEGREPVSLRFETHNWGDDRAGHIWIVGSDVTLEWGAARESAEHHIPIRGA